MDLSIIIVNWNSADYVRRCLASVFAGTDGVEFEVVVVDNASRAEDGIGAMLAREFPQAVFVPSPENIGFGRANNLGVAHSRGRVLLFLNPDTEVEGPAIRVMFEQLQRLPRAGAVGCRLLNGDRTVQTSAIQSFPTLLNQLLDSDWLRRIFPKSALWGTAPLFSPAVEPSPVEAIEGACIMMRREVFDAAGQFTPDYFMYTEDIDLCYKVRRNNWENYYVPQASIVHFGDGSVRRAKSNFAVVMGVETLWRFFRRYRGKAYASIYRGALCLAATARLTLISLRRLVSGTATRPSRGEGGPDSAAKWISILRWTVGLEPWAARQR